MQWIRRGLGKTIGALVLMAAVCGLGAQEPETSATRLEKARQRETIAGDVAGALQDYEAIVSMYQRSDRPIAAQALLNQAGVFRRTGDVARERAAYERILHEFSDQVQPASVARTRLGLPARAPAEISLRKVFNGSFQARVSPDGRYLAHDNWPLANKTIVRDMATGRERSFDVTAFEVAFSRDSSRMAYSWCDGSGPCEIRIVGLLGSPAPRTLFTIDGAFVGPMDWSPDGKTIAAYVNRTPDRVLQFGLIDVSDGKFRVLKSVEWGGGAIRALFAPDGRDIAYDARVTDDSGKRDIYLLAADASREVPLVTNRGDDFVLAWSTDGKHLVFGTDRNGDVGLWAQAVVDRKPQGVPTLIKGNIGGDVRSAGMTKSGALHLGIRTRASTIEIAPIDLATGKRGVPTRPIRTVAEAHRSPDWSRDGKVLTYASLRRNENILGIRSMETGAEREVHLASALDRVASWINLAPDGSYVTYGRDLRGRYGIFRIDANDGRVTPIVFRGPEGRAGVEGFFWSPDGAKMYYRAATAGLGGVVERDVASGTERTVVDGQFRSMTLSPDGRWFTLGRMDMEATKRGEVGTSAVLLAPVGGGEPRELFRGLVMATPQWTPDGRAILVSKVITETVNELWLVPIDGSASRKFEFAVPFGFRLSPDGRQLAYDVGDDKSEVWAVENFMSALKPQ